MGKKELITARKRAEAGQPEGQVAPRPPRPAQLELDFSLDESLIGRGRAILETMAKGTFGPGSFCSARRPGARRSTFISSGEPWPQSGRVLHLVPEIALTEPLVEALESGLGEAAALVHSGLPEARREREWRRIREGRAQVIVGSRLALFAPADNLRLVICDEEQDESYFQQEGLFYDVRVAARLRAAGEGAVLVAGSAAPLVETFFRVP